MRTGAPFVAIGVFVGLVSCSGATERTSAILITLDTTRADELGCYGAQPSLTPHLDRLAAEGLVYERAYTVAPLTLPAHASMLTGLYPLRHGIRDNGQSPLPEEAETIAELAAEAGAQTGAFVAALVLDPAFGLDQGFGVYEAPVRSAERKTDSHYGELGAQEVVDAALAWWKERDPKRPAFLWVHLFDPHSPYEPPPAFRNGHTQRERYRGEIAFADAQIGRLLDALRAQGDLEDTFVLFVADHGESFGEHGESSHGTYCYEPTLRVPLIARYPDGYRAGERSRETVSVVDVKPTLAGALGLEVGSELDGMSFFRREVPAERGVYFESLNGFLNYNWSMLAGWLDAEGKYLHSSEPELFDLRTDPAESVNRVAETDVRRYQRELELLAQRPALEAAGSPAGSAGSIGPDMLADIRALGYASVGDIGRDIPNPLAPSDLPSPQSMREVYGDLLAGLAQSNAGNHAEAVRLFERVLVRNPKNFFALDSLAFSLIELERLVEAIGPLQRLLRDGPQKAGTYYNLAMCLAEGGRREESLAALQSAMNVDPGDPKIARRLVGLLKTEGRLEEARVAEAAHVEAVRAEGGQP